LEDQKEALLAASKARQDVSTCRCCSGFADDEASTERSKLEIELNENLKRNRMQLRGDLDELEGDAGSGVLQAGEVELRDQELKNTISAIENLMTQIQGVSDNLEARQALADE
jgi:structural maintenance of chromosome 3 (chondroitin sulfate proteoglycan 6)